MTDLPSLLFPEPRPDEEKYAVIHVGLPCELAACRVHFARATAEVCAKLMCQDCAAYGPPSLCQPRGEVFTDWYHISDTYRIPCKAGPIWRELGGGKDYTSQEQRMSFLSKVRDAKKGIPDV